MGCSADFRKWASLKMGGFFPQPNDHGNFAKMRFKTMKFGGTVLILVLTNSSRS